MDCVKCRELKQAFEFKLNNYIEARSATYYRVSTELAARKKVDMERARNELEEHRSVCESIGDSYQNLKSV
jgi:hypothetical protein